SAKFCPLLVRNPDRDPPRYWVTGVWCDIDAAKSRPVYIVWFYRIGFGWAQFNSIAQLDVVGRGIAKVLNLSYGHYKGAHIIRFDVGQQNISPLCNVSALLHRVQLSLHLRNLLACVPFLLFNFTQGKGRDQ